MTTLLLALAKVSADEARKTILNAFVEAGRNKLNPQAGVRLHREPVHVQAAEILSAASRVSWRTLYRMIHALKMWPEIDEAMKRLGVPIFRIKQRGTAGPRAPKPKKSVPGRGLALAGGTPDVKVMRASELERRRRKRPSFRPQPVPPAPSRPPLGPGGGAVAGLEMDPDRMDAFQRAAAGLRTRGVRGLAFDAPPSQPILPEEVSVEKAKKRRVKVDKIAVEQVERALERGSSSKLVKPTEAWKPPNPNSLREWLQTSGLPDPDIKNILSIRNDPQGMKAITLAKAGRVIVVDDSSGNARFVRVRKDDVEGARQQLADETEKYGWAMDQKRAKSLTPGVLERIYGAGSGVKDLEHARARVVEASNNLDKLTFLWELGKKNPDPLGTGVSPGPKS